MSVPDAVTRLVAAAVQAVEVADECHLQEDLTRAGRAFTHYATVIARTSPEDQKMAMDCHSEQGNPPPTLIDAFNAFLAAAQRACASNYPQSV